ncbi:TPA: agmatine deiminase family protein [Providencia alcalifaciens]
MPTRRQFIRQTSVISAIGLAASFGVSPIATGDTQSEKLGMMPDEGELQQCAFIAFGAQKAIWGKFTTDVQIALGNIAKAIANYQPVVVFCREDERQLAEKMCGSQNTRFITTGLDDIWMRDIGANFVVNPRGELNVVDFNFNGWGNKQRHHQDTQLAKFQAQHFGAHHLFTSRLIGEGGGIEVDGHGTGMMTESSWVNDNRNPNLTRDQIEKELKKALGLRKIIWLPGIKGKDITDAHVDFYARFVKPGVVLMNLDNDPNSFDYEVTRKHMEILENATDADGRKLKIYTMSPPSVLRETRFSQNNPDFAAGYINYFVINGAVIAPEFGDKQADDDAKQLLEMLYPDRDIIMLNIDVIAAGGGGIHCVTHQLPVHKG